MPPYAGEGVNVAMLDALELSEALLYNEDTTSAIKEYQRVMLLRAEQITKMTMENTIAFHQAHALETILNLFESFEKGGFR